MRIAVALPSIALGAPHRERLDATIGALEEQLDIETFGESSRLREGCGTRHYLRFDARHREAPFDAALYPIGRDFRIYEPAVYLARRFPSLVWLLDTAVHHLLVGGVAQRGRWDDYLETMRREFDDAGWRAGATVAWGWGTRALYRCFDPAASEFGRQRMVVSASPAIAGDIGRFAGETPVVPLPDVDAPRAAGRQRRGLLLMTPDLGRPLPGLRVLAAFHARRPDVPLTYCLPQNVYEDSVAGLAASEGLGETLRWRISPDEYQQAALVDEAAVVVAETTDPGIGERSLARRAVAGGALLVVPSVPGWEEIPDDASVKIRPGRRFESTLAAALALVHEDEELVSAVSEQARRWARAQPRAARVASRLVNLLVAAGAEMDGAGERWHAAGAWNVARRSVERRATPRSGSRATRDLVASRLAAAAGGIDRAGDSSGHEVE